MTLGIINPGAGAIRGATLRGAWKNARTLRREILAWWDAEELAPPRVSGILLSEGKRTMAGRDQDGRYEFVFGWRQKLVTVDVPGCALERIREAWFAGDDPFVPRLYVDGSSWYWPFAVSVLMGQLGMPKKREKEEALHACLRDLEVAR